MQWQVRWLAVGLGRALLVAIGVLAATVSATWAANLVPNPGFEAGGATPDDWAPGNEVTIARDTTQAHTGNASLLMTHRVDPSHDGITTSIPFAVSPSTLYQFSYWYRVTDTSNVDFVD